MGRVLGACWGACASFLRHCRVCRASYFGRNTIARGPTEGTNHYIVPCTATRGLIRQDRSRVEHNVRNFGGVKTRFACMTMGCGADDETILLPYLPLTATRGIPEVRCAHHRRHLHPDVAHPPQLLALKVDVGNERPLHSEVPANAVRVSKRLSRSAEKSVGPLPAQQQASDGERTPRL